jgi:predicted kinase
VSGRLLIVLCGPAFSGKSTLARAIAGRSGAAVVCLDEINARRGLHGGEGVPDQQWAATHREALTEVERLVAAGTRHIVVDDTSCYRFLRDDYRAVAERLGYRFVLLVVDTPLELIRERIRANAATANRGGIRPEVFERHVASFEWPGDDEPHVVLRSEADVEAWLVDILP